MRKHRDNERGATLVEAAISYSLLFLTLFAVVEFGLAFKDWLSVGHAAREGARAGATFGQAPNTDILLLREVEDTLGLTGLPVGTDVTVFRANNPDINESTTYTFGTSPDCGTDPGWSGTPDPLPGCCNWDPCPEPGRPTYVEPNWAPSDRDVEAPGTDRIGVTIEFQHEWITGLFMDTTDFTTTTDFQLEPELFSP